MKTKAYKYIVERIVAYHGTELQFSRKYLRNYILFDVMNDIFMQKDSLDIRLLLQVYQGLHTLLATDYQYLHQYAKCYIKCAKKSRTKKEEQLDYYREGVKHCNLALANVEADLEKNENEKDAQLAMKKIDEIMKITAELERRNADGDKKAEEELEKWSKDIEELDIQF